MLSLAQDWHHRLLKKQFAHLHIVKITLNIFPRYPGKSIAHQEEVPITLEPGKYTLGPVLTKLNLPLNLRMGTLS
jgi:hypothetical protein